MATEHSVPDITETIFGWSLQDIFNPQLFQLDQIPDTFDSVQHYLGSFVLPLLEETRAQLHSSMETISRAPFAEVIEFDMVKPSSKGNFSFSVEVDYWRSRSGAVGKDAYTTMPGDIVVLTNALPKTASDLQRVGKIWTFAMVTLIKDDEDEVDSVSTNFRVMAPKNVKSESSADKSLFIIYLTNVLTNRRVWNSLHMHKNMNIIREVLCPNSKVQENCSVCSTDSRGIWDEKCCENLSSLNESQTKAVLACVSKRNCKHKSTVELIWGPPGTGKTKTVSVLLFNLLRSKCRTITCAPTNIAVVELASRVLKLVKQSNADSLFPFLGDILLFGNKRKLKSVSEVEDIYFDNRVERLVECFSHMTGWWHCLMSAIDFLEDCVSQYSIFLENEMIEQKRRRSENEEEKFATEMEIFSDFKPFLEFFRGRFRATVLPLRKCFYLICTHMPESYIKKDIVEIISVMFALFDSLETSIFRDNLISEQLEQLFSHSESVEGSSEGFADVLVDLQFSRVKCISTLRMLRDSLVDRNFPRSMNKLSLQEFCFKTASLFFCTVSSSFKIHRLEIKPLELLVIDEAAQLKECESAIPFQLDGIRHAVLVGDECQLPAMVESKLSDDAGFGRSAFERLSSLGHPKHLLNIQYRMHPSISRFPNSKFYSNLIIDAANVKTRSYEKQFLSGTMYGPFSFINVLGGREERDDLGHSRKNMVEVALVLKLVQSLYKAWNGSKKELKIGVISPYTAQVVAIQKKLGETYKNGKRFIVKVKSVDGFQGGEEDVIILSTVRSNSGGAIGFMSDPRRTNVALTRARHCLWILGNERTLSSSDSVWKLLVRDAKDRQCFFNVDEDKGLADAILEHKKELNQLEDLLQADGLVFKGARWKFVFTDFFRMSFNKLPSARRKMSVLDILRKVSDGWRPKKSMDTVTESSTKILKQFKVEGLCIICSVDIVKEVQYTQVLKVWDILPREGITRLVKYLDGIFEKYNQDFISHCSEKCMEGDLVVPKTWYSSFIIVRFENLRNNEARSNAIFAAPNGRFNNTEKKYKGRSKREKNKTFPVKLQLGTRNVEPFMNQMLFQQEGNGKRGALEERDEKGDANAVKSRGMMKGKIDASSQEIAGSSKQGSSSNTEKKYKGRSKREKNKTFPVKLQLGTRNVEPFLNQMLFQQEGNGKRGALEERDEKGDANAVKSRGMMKGKIDASSQETAGSSKQGSSSNTEKKYKGRSKREKNKTFPVKLQLGTRNVEPFLNQMLFQQEGNGKRGALEERDEKGDANAVRSRGMMKGKIDASSQETAGSSKQGSSSNTEKKYKGRSKREKNKTEKLAWKQK